MDCPYSDKKCDPDNCDAVGGCIDNEILEDYYSERW